MGKRGGVVRYRVSVSWEGTSGGKVTRFWGDTRGVLVSNGCSWVERKQMLDVNIFFL